MDKQTVFINAITDVTIKKGLLKFHTYTLLFTDDSIIFARLTKEIKKADYQALKEDVKGKGLRERMAAFSAHSLRYLERYQTMSKSDILKESIDNFELSKHHITKVKTPLGVSYDQNDQIIPKKIKIHTNNAKYELRFQSANESDRAFQILKDYTKT